MIDWTQLIFNILWVFGFATILSAFSYYNWVAQMEEKKRRELWQQPSFQLWLWLGLAFVAGGFAGNSAAVWETVVWFALALGAIYYTIDAW